MRNLARRRPRTLDGEPARDPAANSRGQEHQADHPRHAVRGRVEAEARPGCDAPARPYSEKIDEVLADLATVLGGDEHPLLAKREGGKRLIVLVTSDRGLAGPFNTNTIRFAAQAITEHKGDLAVVTVGRKGRDAMRRARVPMEAHFEGFGDRPTFADVLPLARLITDDYLAGTYNRVDIVFSQFVSTLTQRPALDTLLPIEPSEDTEGIPGNQFIFEPSPARRPRAARARATSRPASSRRSWRARPARNRAGWSRCATPRTTPRT